MTDHTLSDDLESLRGVGHGVLALVNTAVLLAIVAVILAPGSSTAQVIKDAFALLSWLVAQVIKPVTGGFNVQPSTQYAPAGGYSVGAGDSSSGTSSSSSSASPGVGTGSGTSPSTVWVNTATWQSVTSPTRPSGGTWVPANQLGGVVNVGSAP